MTSLESTTSSLSHICVQTRTHVHMHVHLFPDFFLKSDFSVDRIIRVPRSRSIRVSEYAPSNMVVITGWPIRYEQEPNSLMFQLNSYEL